MPQTYSAIRDKIEQVLQDNSNAVYSTGELDKLIADTLANELADAVPHILEVSYNLESRTGQATSTAASALVDTTESQFTSGDVGKVVFNSTDQTWAVVTAFVSTGQVTLSRDIMAANESYRIFNKKCQHQHEINIEDVLDYLYVDHIEFPVAYNPPRYRDYTFPRDGIVRLTLDGPIDDTKETDARKEVLVRFARRHKLTQLTDFAAAVNNSAGYAAAATSIILDALQASGTIEVDQEFTIDDLRGIYVVTAETAIASSAATISFYPGLESSVGDNAVINFAKSSLTPQLETILVDLVAGKAAISKAHYFHLLANTAVTTLATAATAVATADARLDQAVTYLGSGDNFIETVNIGEPVGGYAQYAAREVANAMARLSEGGGSFNKAAYEIRLTQVADRLKAWGQEKVSYATIQLNRLRKRRVVKRYSREI